MSQPQPNVPLSSEESRGTQNTFKVHKEANLATADDYERAIQELREKATIARESEQKRQAIKLAQEQDAKYKKLDELNETLETLNLVNGLSSKLSLTDAMDLAEEKRKIMHQIEDLENELGFFSVEGRQGEARKTFGLSSSKALWAIAGLTLLSFLLFWAMGTAAVSEDPMNDSARRMMNSVGLRVLTNFLPFSIAILAAVGFIWLLFPSVFGYWHNKVSTSFSLISDLEQCEPYHRVAFFAFSYGLPLWAFVQLMQVIFG